MLEDWATSQTRFDRMQREAFCDGLFELADLWTDSISEADYSEFLDLLFNRITKKVLDKKTGQYAPLCLA